MSSDEQEASHVPTGDRVFQICHHSNLNPNSSESPSGTEIPEIDFMDLDRFMHEIKVLEAEAASLKDDTCISIKIAEGQTTTTTVEESFMGDRIDNKPSPLQDSLTPANHIAVERPDLGEVVEDDDEIIVYVAPNPRKGMRLSSSVPSFSAPVVTPLADREPVSGQVQQGTNDLPSPTASPAKPTLEHIPTPSPKLSPVLTFGDVSNAALSGPSRSVRRARRLPHVSKRRVKRHVTFGSFGAIRAGAVLRDVDPQRDEQRRGESDVDWGDSTSWGSLEDGGMLTDHDVDVHAMEVFVNGMSIAGSAQVTADDLEDEARIRAEEEDEDEEKSDSDSVGSTDQYSEELELAGETRIMLVSDEEDIAIEDDPVESECEGTSEEEGSSRESFQARLERLRKRTQRRPIRDVLKDELDGELEVEEEHDIIVQIQVIRSKSPNVSLVTHASTAGIPR